MSSGMPQSMLLRQFQQGFTLIELMVVMLLIGLLSGLVMLGVGGNEQRNQLLARSQLEGQLRQLALESLDQGRLIGLQTRVEQDKQYYFAVSLDLPDEQSVMPNAPVLSSLENRAGQNAPQWRPLSSFKAQALPDGVTLNIEPLQIVQGHTWPAGWPTVVWLGNGESRPARLQLNHGDQLIGEPIYVWPSGRVDTKAPGQAGLP